MSCTDYSWVPFAVLLSTLPIGMAGLIALAWRAMK